MYRKLFNMFSLLLVMAVAFSAVGPVSAQSGVTFSEDGFYATDLVPESSNGIYIVQMKQSPVVAYAGDVEGLSATKVNSGEKINFDDQTVKAYAEYLTEQHNVVLEKVGGEKVNDYNYSFNGFSARMSLAQANKLAKVEGVVQVTPDELWTADTSSTPTFLGLTDRGGLWKKLGGVEKAGQNVVIGVIDTGIWPESLSFSDTQNKKKQWTDGTGLKDKVVYKPLPGWSAACELDGAVCNNKLIGAYYYNDSWSTATQTGDQFIAANFPWEFLSARDYGGHGTHTSSTSGGNYGVPVTGDAAGVGNTISGIAPRARIVMYKALWEVAPGVGNGRTGDLMSAIDQAITDGVDVINYSISGSLTNFADPVEIMFMFAADYGVFVAASAGNSGPATSTVAHPSPWITTVAAGTHNRTGTGQVVVNGITYNGASMSPAVTTGVLVNAEFAGAAGSDSSEARRCFAAEDNGGVDVLDPVVVTGKIVICDRGTNALVNKSLAVKRAGGIGMILLNVSVNNTPALIHSVPTIHLEVTDAAAIKAYAAANPLGTAQIKKAKMVFNLPAPYTASFSSRGPLLAGAGDLLKPDLIAPGQDILAAVAPTDANSGRSFDLYSGTSMSSPHVAGLAALLIDKHPTWSPMMVKSALMTTGYDVLDGPATDPSVIFNQGAGHVRPNKAVDPGLVFDSNWYDWNAFLCGTIKASYESCSGLASAGYSLDPSDMNVPSIAIGALAGEQTVTRRVTNVAVGREKYTFSYSGLAGITVTPDASSFTLNKNQSRALSVTFTTNGAAPNTYVGGYITWMGSRGHVVRIPVVIKPVTLAAPAAASGSYDVTFGYDGPFTATPRGLVAAQTFTGAINTNGEDCYSVVAPAGTTYLRFSLFDAETTPAGSDLDLSVYNNAGTKKGASGSGTSSEEVNLLSPAADTYWGCVEGFATGSPSNYTLYAWVLDSANAGNMTVSAPPTAVIGGTGLIDVTFTGSFTSGVKYLGSIVYGGAAGMPNPTIIRYNAP